MTPPSDPAARDPRRRIVLFLLALGALAFGGWRYRVTRPDYRFARGQEALRAGDFLAATACADTLEGAGDTDRAALLRTVGARTCAEAIEQLQVHPHEARGLIGLP